MFSGLIGLVRHLHLSPIDRSRTLTRIQLILAATFLIGAGLLCIVTIRHARNNAAADIIQRGDSTAWIVSRNATRDLETESTAAKAKASLEQVLYDIRSQDGLDFACILDRSQNVIVHTDGRLQDRPFSGPDVPAADWHPLAADGYYYTAPGANGATVYTIIRPIHVHAGENRTRYSGDLELRLGFVLPGYSAFIGDGLKRLTPALAAIFILLIIGSYVAGILVRPLSVLKAETEEAAKAQKTDNWQLDLDADASGEVAEIARNWNSMVQNFRSSYQMVIEARRDLEVRNRIMLYEKKRTESIIDSLGDGVIVIDSDNKISYVNRESENLLGINRTTAFGQAPTAVLTDAPLRDFINVPLTKTDALAENGSAIPQRKPQRRAADVQVTRRNGTRHLRLTLVPAGDSNGTPGGSVLLLRDVTQEKLEETARKEFISSVTHELRAPLTSIKSYVEMLIDDEAKDPNLQREFFNTINEEADRLARLINDMLNMSKIEVGNLVLNKSLVRTKKLVEDAVNGLRSAAKGKAIDLDAAISPALPDIEADKELVRVVVTNLLSNGIKYTQEGGRVALSAELAHDPSGGPGNVIICIEDNGPGIPEDELEKIFDKFYRGRNTAGQKVVGNGLGLAIAREIATLHGGDIKVSSAIGQGSRFTFVLPALATSRKVS